MENKNILMLKHHPMNIKYTNLFYVMQTSEDLSDYIIIDVTSRVERDQAFMQEHPTFSQDLSPFFIGPVKGTDGAVANIFELFWQCGKVYPCHDNQGTPNDEFFIWRNEYYSKTTCTKDLMRHTCKSLGYEHKDCLYFAYFDLEKKAYVPLNFVQARKKVYIPEYAKLVYNTESFEWLKSLVDAGQKIALVDFDSYNYNETCGRGKKFQEYMNKCRRDKIEPTIPVSAFLGIQSMKDALNCPFLSAGHGFILKALLQGDLKVVNGEVVDCGGVLED